MKIELEYLYDEHNCETCGATYSEGGRIWFDGELQFELIPVAHCFGGDHLQMDLMQKALELLGHEVIEHDNYVAKTCGTP